MTKLVRFDHIPKITNYHMPYVHGNFRFRVHKDGLGEVTLEKKDKGGRRHQIWGSISEEGLLSLWAALDQYVRAKGLHEQVETEAEYWARVKAEQEESDRNKDAFLSRVFPD